MPVENQSSAESIDSFIVKWNNMFPFDFWWRRKYKVAFNSKDHREACPIDIFFEHREEELIKKAISPDNSSEEIEDAYEGFGGFLRQRSKFKEDISQDEIEQDFENMEI